MAAMNYDGGNGGVLVHILFRGGRTDRATWPQSSVLIIFLPFVLMFISLHFEERLKVGMTAFKMFYSYFELCYL